MLVLVLRPSSAVERPPSWPPKTNYRPLPTPRAAIPISRPALDPIFTTRTQASVREHPDRHHEPRSSPANANEAYPSQADKTRPPAFLTAAISHAPPTQPSAYIHTTYIAPLPASRSFFTPARPIASIQHLHLQTVNPTGPCRTRTWSSVDYTIERPCGAGHQDDGP